ncbi:DNA-binding transcriptional repressor MarR [compost metagenome]
MSVIQEQMIAKTSNTTRLVDKLLLKGLVIRETCPQNRRKIEVSLTAKGQKLLNNSNTAVSLHEEKFAYNLTPKEHESINFLLEKYRNKTV